MNIDDFTSRDFRLIDAAGLRTDALRKALAFESRYVVVRHATGVPDEYLYYLFQRDELKEILARSKAEKALVALNLVAQRSVPTIFQGSHFQPPTEHSVLIGDLGPVGVVEPTAKRRGGESSGKRFNAGEGAATDSGSDASAGTLTRSLIGDLPSEIGAGAEVSLLVSLASIAPPGANAAELDMPAGTIVNVLVKPVENLTLVDTKDSGDLKVEEPQSDLPLRFLLKAGGAGRARVQVYGFCGGTAVAKLDLVAQVAGRTTAAPPPRVSGNATIALVPMPMPDLTLYILEYGEDELGFRLQSADGRFQLQDCGRVTQRTSPRDHFREFFRDIENLPLDADTARKLELRGANLFATVFPPDLQEILWQMRSRIKTVQIASEEPWIPWEVCRLQGVGDGGRIEEGGFFAEAFEVTRWNPGVSVALNLSLRNLALVVPEDSGLTYAAEEKAFVHSLAEKDVRSVNDVAARFSDVTSEMAKGAYDAWHFTGHARADQAVNADQATIELTGRQSLVAGDITGRVQRVLDPRPFVFLNGCQSAQGGLSLTGVGGWAQRFLPPKCDRAASAFIGAYWSVDDRIALAFTKALYTGLVKERKPIGEAAKNARLAIKKENDPTWLAYTVYAHPQAAVR